MFAWYSKKERALEAQRHRSVTEYGISEEVDVIPLTFSMEWGLVRWSLVRKTGQGAED